MSTPIIAEENTPEAPSKWTLTGNVQVGGASINSTEQLRVDGTNERNTSLDSDAPSYTTELYAVLVDLTYYNSESKSQFYVRTPIDADLAISVGGAKELAGGGTVDISVFTKLSHSVWKDPYVINQTREDTPVGDYGVSLRYDDISYSLNMLDVEDDKIGERFSDLKRDGIIHSLTYAPKIPLNETSELDPKLIYSRADLQGRSQRSNSYTLALMYQYLQPRYTFNAEIKAIKSVYDEEHPIFGLTREDQSYSGTAFFTWLDPLGYKGYFNTWVVNYSCSDSNIAFFDSCTSIAGLTIGYRF